MSLRYALFPGCAAKGATPELYQSTMAVIARLGIEIVELEAASCCGAGVVSEADPIAGLALSARTFAQAERLGLDVMTICGTCQGVMGPANKRLKEDPGLLERVNDMLAPEGYTYQGTVKVKHLLWVVVSEYGLHRLGDHITMPTHGLHIAPFYGCYILRPSWYLGFDDPENPTSLEKIIQTVGGEPVSYAGRTKCCGFPIILEKEAIAVAMAGKNMGEAQHEGAHCMVTPCPLCHMALDIYQDRASQASRTPLNLPILHLPQLLGIAMGIPTRDLGVSRHLVPVESIMRRIPRSSTRPQPS